MIFNKITINGSEFTDAKNINVSRAMSENNGASSFSVNFDNFAGLYASDFPLNAEVEIYAEKDVNPPTNKIFSGVLEDVDYNGDGVNEKIKISGRDFSAILQDILISPISYRDEEVSVIILDIMNNHASDITTNNVDVTTTTIDRITFNHINVFDALKQMAEISGFYFYVDEDKDLHFEERQGVSSGETLDNTNVLSATTNRDEQDIYNQVWVYGKRVLTGANDEFTADGAGSVFTLDAKPHNTRVSEESSLVQPGGVFGVDDPFLKDVKYLVDFDKQQIIFTSGTSSGDNLPASGNTISVDYEKSTPIVKFKQDTSSVSSHGKKTKLIVDKNIQSFEEANDKATAFISEHKDPLIEVNANIGSFMSLVPGNTVNVNLPNHDISGTTYSIMDVNYNFNPRTILNDNPISIRLNKKRDKFEDTIKEILLKQKTLETGELQGNLTNFQSIDDDVEVQRHYELYSTSGTNHSFKFHFDGHNQLNSPQAVLGPWVNGSTLLTSGGDF